MASREKRTPAMEEALNAAQVLFTANPLFLAPQTTQFWHAQDRILDEIERFSSGWFKRRQDATQSMIDAGRRLASEGQADPADVIREIIDWQVHSMERLAEDARDCTEMFSRCTGAFTGNEAAADTSAEALKRTAKSGQSKPA